MSDDDRQHWDARYQGGSGPGDIPPVLQRAEPLLPTAGLALDVACGAGAATCWLARHRIDVESLDISPIALSLLRKAAVEQGVAGRVRTIEADLDEGIPASVSAELDVMVCLRFRTPLLSELAKRLRSGGLVIASALSVVGRADPATDGPDPRFLAEPGELAHQLAALDIVEHVEADGLASIIARRGTG